MYDEKEIIAMIQSLIVGENVELFEKKFADYVGSKYAIMVNSGASANLLAMAVATNYRHRIGEKGLNPGDKILIPAICCPTSVWTIVQMNLVPVFVDVDANTLNINLDDMEKKISLIEGIRGVVAVHTLGNCTNIFSESSITDNDVCVPAIPSIFSTSAFPLACEQT